MSHNEVIDKLEQQPATLKGQEMLITLVNQETKKKRGLCVLIALLSVVTVAGLWFTYYYSVPEATQTRVYQFIQSLFTSQLLFYIGVGLAAQIVDGALGMAYGATSSSLLLGLGI